MFPRLIHDICPSCNPRTYVKTVAKFIMINEDDKATPLLYQCTKCNSKLWVDEQWAFNNQVKNN